MEELWMCVPGPGRYCVAGARSWPGRAMDGRVDAIVVFVYYLSAVWFDRYVVYGIATCRSYFAYTSVSGVR